jgi:D-3-phosphoglycerate dehydrogenase
MHHGQTPFQLFVIDDVHASFFDELQGVPNLQMHYEPHLSKEAAIALLPNANGLVVRSKLFLSASVLQAAKGLRLIARAGAGMDNIDEQAASRLGIALLNAPEGNRNAVAEHALGLLLALVNHIASADAEVRTGKWLREWNRGIELEGRTAGIIGFGNCGERLAHKLAALGMRVLAYDKYKTGYSTRGILECSLQELQQQAEIVSIHIPLTQETDNLVNASFFEAFTRPIWLLNTSRGAILNLADALVALKNGQLLGLGLDVLENERLDSLTPEQQTHFAQLAAMPNVVFTPHVAGWTHESYRLIANVLGRKVAHWLQESRA